MPDSRMGCNGGRVDLYDRTSNTICILGMTTSCQFIFIIPLIKGIVMCFGSYFYTTMIAHSQFDKMEMKTKFLKFYTTLINICYFNIAIAVFNIFGCFSSDTFSTSKYLSVYLCSNGGNTRQSFIELDILGFDVQVQHGWRTQSLLLLGLW